MVLSYLNFGGKELMTKAGAKVVDTLKDFKKYPNLHHVIVVEYDEEDPPLSNSDVASEYNGTGNLVFFFPFSIGNNTIVIYRSDGLQIYQAITIEFDWVLETIGRNRLVPFAEYELVEIPQDILQQYNFPPEMLRYENTEDFE